MNNKNAYRLEKLNAFLENPKILKNPNENVDIHLLIKSFDINKKKQFEERTNDLIVKIDENSEEYGVVFSLNKRDYITNNTIDEILIYLAPSKERSFTEREYILFVYFSDSLLTIQKPNRWLTFLREYFAMLLYDKVYDELDKKEANHIHKTIDYVCLQFVYFFEMLKTPVVSFEKKFDYIILGYRFNNNIENTEEFEDKQKIQNCVYIYLNKDNKADYNDNTYNSFLYTSKTNECYEFGVNEILTKNKDCNIFVFVENSTFLEKRGELYGVLLKQILLLSFELEGIFKNNSNVLCDVEKNEELITLYKESVEKEYTYIVAYILNVLEKYKNRNISICL